LWVRASSLTQQNNQRDAACSLRLYFLLSTLHVSGALCAHHQEYLKTLHAVLVQSFVDGVADPVSCGMAWRWERLARVVAKSVLI
jgi:hypothetical protein